MTTAELPGDGELRLGPVALPPGRRVIPDGHEPVAWVTSQAVPDPGRAWAGLHDLHSDTGLVPVLLPDDADAEAEGFYFYDPVGADAIDEVDAAGVLTSLWDGAHQDMSEPARLFDAPLSRDFLGLKTAAEGGNGLAGIVEAIFGAVTDPGRREELERLNQQDRENAGWPPPPVPGGTVPEPPPFPGLAPAELGRLTAAELAAALGSLEPARIGLVPAARAADVLALTGWFTFGQWREEPNGVWIGSVLRSWEDRFRARLLNVGPGAEIRLLVERPPRTRGTAEKIAAEHSVFCDECAGQGLRDIPQIADALVGASLWTFWWD
jgi:Domain of unknown function (DUF4253)